MKTSKIYVFCFSAKLWTEKGKRQNSVAYIEKAGNLFVARPVAA